MRRFAFALLASAMAFSTFATQLAQAQTCFTLQAELEHLQNQGGVGGNRSRYERAFREQANVLARTEARARNAGCFQSGFRFFRQRPERTCRTLVPKLRDMQNNLARLDQLRRRGGGGNERRVRQVRAEIAARGCGIPGRDQWNEARDSGRTVPDAPYSRRGTFRTLCVRICDGYYFPISFSTTREQFGNDAQTCSSMCPGAEARLFYHANPGGGPEDMVSLEESRYSDLPTAFQYRTSLSPSCTCKPAGGFSRGYSEIGANPVGYVPAEELDDRPAAPPAALAPRPRPAPGEDPETLANRDGNLNPASVAGDAPATASAVTSDGRGVRIVGPAYWAAPEQEGVVLTPVPN